MHRSIIFQNFQTNSSFRISFILLSSFLFYVFLDFRSTRRKRNRPKRATSATRQKRGAWFSRQARATQLNERIFVLPRLRLSYLSASCVSAGHFVRRWLRSNTKKLRPTSEQARRWIPPDESGTLCTCVPTYTVSQFVISAEEKYTERERKREMKIKIDTEKPSPSRLSTNTPATRFILSCIMLILMLFLVVRKNT